MTCVTWDLYPHRSLSSAQLWACSLCPRYAVLVPIFSSAIAMPVCYCYVDPDSNFPVYPQTCLITMNLPGDQWAVFHHDYSNWTLSQPVDSHTSLTLDLTHYHELTWRYALSVEQVSGLPAHLAGALWDWVLTGDVPALPTVLWHSAHG